MIKRKSEMEKEIRERMRDGSGRVEITHVFKKEELKGRVRLFARIKLEKNCSIGYHRHENEEEALQVIAYEETEIEMFRKYSDYYGYVFYIMKAN